EAASVAPAADVRNPRRETTEESSCGVVIRKALWCGSVQRGGGIGGTQLKRSRPDTRAPHCRRSRGGGTTGCGNGSACQAVTPQVGATGFASADGGSVEHAGWRAMEEGEFG